MNHMNVEPRAPTGIVLMNLGGPQTTDAVAPYLRRMFLDRELIPLPLQRVLGPFIASRRAPKVALKYGEIGGKSPIYDWTQRQGTGMVQWLDTLSPETAPHKFYIGFRYAEPLAETALLQMRADGVSRAIAFSQYPQWSCSTTGASLNDLWRTVRRLDAEQAFKWSIIDRWPVHTGFIAAMADTVRRGVDLFDPADRGDVLLLFSAHSLPLSVIDRGDAYPQEIGASVQAVMTALGFSHKYMLAYQSDIGPVRWLGPNTDKVVQQFGRSGPRHVLVVPIAFTSDHIETLHEIDIEMQETAKHAGVILKRAPALNDSPLFIRAMADVVLAHLHNGEVHSAQYPLKCAGCVNDQCRVLLNPAHM